MISHLIDTNCLLSFVTDRNPAQHKKTEEIFESASKSDEEITIIANVITEFVYVLDSIYGIEKKAIKELITDLLANPGISFHPGYFPEILFSFWPDSIRDYGDAVLASAAKQLNLLLYTFDKKFANSLTKLNIEVTLL